MKILKNILLSNYLLKIILFLIIIISFIRISLNNKSKYDLKEESFQLIVDKVYYKNQKYVIEFIGKEKLISYYEKEFPYDIGDILNVKGTLYKADNKTIPNLFNYQKYLENKDIYYLININEMSLYKRNNNLLNNIKKSIIKRISKIPKNEYLYTFILGDKHYLNDDIKNSFSYNNLSYLLAIGSLHVYLIAKILDYFQRKIRIKEKYHLIIISLIFSFFFLLFRENIGILRSLLCYLIKRILKYFHIKYKYSNVIIIVGIIFLLINPKYLYHIGFLYSFIISYGISLYRKIIKGSYCQKLLKITLLATSLSIPITIYNNYEINFLGIVISFIFNIIFHFLLFPLSIIVFIFPFLGNIYNIVFTIIENITLSLSNITIFNVIFPKPSIFIVIIYYFILLLKPSKNFFYYSLLMLLIYKIIFKILLNDFVLFLDVNQGDSCIIKNNNNVYVIDTGSGINDYSSDIINYLHSIGINKINTLFISHGDYDHIGSAINLTNNINIDNVIFNCGELNDLENDLINNLNKKKIKHYSCVNQINRHNITLLNTKIYDNENDNSLVMLINMHNYNFMFMGDASSTTEKEILNRYNLPDINILKVGHHGSKTSSSNEFIKKINPKYSIISVGKNNLYGHPNKEVLDNLQDSKIYRTDQDGSIMFKIKNKKLKIETCSP